MRRKVDPADRRSVLVQRTVKGAAFLRDLRSILSEAATAARKGQTATHEPAKRAARG